jgi:pimeloyl-ACP methyl ester carboxylesterase
MAVLDIYGTHTMANFVLVHGSWHGAWCWQRVGDALSAAGHRVFAVNLTGVGERAHLLTPDLTLQTHVTDVLATLEANELRDVVLAVHSYAGMIGTAVADRAAERLRHLVYVDAVIPAPGETWGSRHTTQTREARTAAIAASPMRTIPVPDAAIFGLSGADRDWVNRRMTPQPGRAYSEALDFDMARVGAVARTFISCTSPTLDTIDATRVCIARPDFWAGHWAPKARVWELATGHDPMVSAPEALTQMLLRCAE